MVYEGDRDLSQVTDDQLIIAPTDLMGVGGTSGNLSLDGGSDPVPGLVSSHPSLALNAWKHRVRYHYHYQEEAHPDAGRLVWPPALAKSSVATRESPADGSSELRKTKIFVYRDGFTIGVKDAGDMAMLSLAAIFDDAAAGRLRTLFPVAPCGDSENPVQVTENWLALWTMGSCSEESRVLAEASLTKHRTLTQKLPHVRLAVVARLARLRVHLTRKGIRTACSCSLSTVSNYRVEIAAFKSRRHIRVAKFALSGGPPEVAK